VYTINVNGGSASTLQAMAGPAGGSGGDPVFFNDINDPLNIPTVFGNLAAHRPSEKVIMEDTLANVLDALADGNGVPLDGNRATLYDELSDDPNDPDREEAFRGDGVMHCVALSWELPVRRGQRDPRRHAQIRPRVLHRTGAPQRRYRSRSAGLISRFTPAR